MPRGKRAEGTGVETGATGGRVGEKKGALKESKIECSRVNNATRSGIGVSAEILERSTLGKLPRRETRAGKDGKKERKKEGGGGEEEGKDDRRGAALGTRCLYHRVTMAE